MSATAGRAALGMFGVLGVLLAAGLAAELMLPASGGAEPEALAAIRAAPRLPRLDAVRAGAPALDHTDAWVATILARPLFSRDRRPGGGQVTAAAADERLPRLTGIAFSPFGRSAIFAPPSGGTKPVVVGEGGSVGPYTVKAIRPELVQVTGPGGPRSLSPAFDPTPHGTDATADASVTPGVPFGAPGRLPQFGRPPFLNGAFRPQQQFERAVAPNLPTPPATDDNASQ